MFSGKDTLYASPIGNVAGFTFDQSVAAVFQDMIRRSVPGYSAMISAIGLLAGRFAQEGSNCYDLGCSLGAAALSMRHRITARNCRIIAVDNSAAMINRCKENVGKDRSDLPVDLICADIRDVEIEKASVAVLNFTLQFIPIKDRDCLLSRIYDGLLPGGVLILSEKLKFSDPRQQTLQAEMHHAFKKANDYSDLEISQKRTALEDVLMPETLQRHSKRLSDAGFGSSEVWFQYFNFASLIALK